MIDDRRKLFDQGSLSMVSGTRKNHIRLSVGADYPDFEIIWTEK